MDVREHSGAKGLIESLRDNHIDMLVESAASDIDTVAFVLGIDPSYLSVQVRLLLPFYSQQQLIASPGIDLIRNILAKLRGSLANFEKVYQLHRRQNGIDLLSKDAKLISNAGLLKVVDSRAEHSVEFKTIESAIGFQIQQELHYIHKARTDTEFHFGMSLGDRAYPICYCALSRCDREYQASALCAMLEREVKKSEILVLTRSYGFSPLPSNTMSKLFDRVATYLSQRKDISVKYIITALNPFLGFKGSIFLGSSYVPFATSPMAYHYSEEGLYLNRRNSAQGVVTQRYQTPPIIWLTRAVRNRNAQRKLELLKRYYVIAPDQYDHG